MFARRRPPLVLVLVTACSSAASMQLTQQDLADRVQQAITLDALETKTRAIVEFDRLGGSPGENAAIDSVVSWLRADGIPVDVHEYDVWASDPKSAAVDLIGHDIDLETITIAFSASGSSEGPLVDMGTSRNLPPFEWGTGERVTLQGDVDATPPASNVSGAIAVITGRPGGTTTMRLQLMGAVGVIFVNPEERLNDLTVTTTWGNPSLRSYHRLPEIPVVHVSRSGGEAIRGVMANGTVRARITAELDNHWKPVRLPVARVMPEGNDGAPYVLVGGHIDGWHTAGTDEGAANAAMVELTRAFHANRGSLQRGLLMAWWPAHSNARYAGSTWFADRFFDELRNRAVSYVNMDAIGMIGARLWDAYASPALEPLVRATVLPKEDEEFTIGPAGRNSDMAFNGVGLPLLMVIHNRLDEDEGWWFWHTPEDDITKVDFDILKTDADVHAAFLSEMLASPAFPLDLVREIDAFGAAMQTRQEQANGTLDFGEAQRRLGELRRVARELQVMMATTPSAELDLTAVRMLRPLNRILYDPLSPFHPDPSFSRGLLPGFAPARILAEDAEDSHRYNVAMTSMMRETNRLLEALQTAVEVGKAVRR